MPTIRSITPEIDQTLDQLTKVQVWVSLRDKRRILSAVGDDGVFTFVIRTQFQRLAQFIKDNDINSFDPSGFDRFVNFVRNGTDSRPDRVAAVFDDTRATTRSEHKVQAVTGSTGRVSKGGKGRSGKQTKSVKGQESN